MNRTNAQSGHVSGQLFRYTLLPGLLPRTLNLFTSGFSTLAFYIANIFGAVKIFPTNHPYLRKENYQNFGLISVLAEGSRSITWDRKHIDQIAAFLIIMTAFIVFLMQFLILGSSVLMGSAFAGANDLILDLESANSFEFFFVPSNVEQDYALRALDLIFGLQNLAGTSGYFESCIGTAVICEDFNGNNLANTYNFPTPMHAGFHSLIHFYNYAIIGLGFVILFYYLVTMAAETTINGTFWGQRGNKTWIPVRVIFFLALIMPFYQGFNLAQVVTLNAAYFGTGMASNAWREVTDVVGDELAGQQQDLIAPPSRNNFPSSVGMVRYMSMVQTCNYAEELINGRIIDAFIVKNRSDGALDNCRMLDVTSYGDALTFSNNENVRIRFGQRVPYTPVTAPSPAEIGDFVPCTETNPGPYANMPEKYGSEPGYVVPYCGEIVISNSGIGTIGFDIAEGNYDTLINDLWLDTDIENVGREFTESAINDVTTYSPDFNIIRDIIRASDAQIETNIIAAVDDALMATPSEFDLNASLGDCGWMCAALYYNRIAEANGVIQSSIYNTPDIRLWPATSEEVLDSRALTDRSSDICDKFNPSLPGEQTVDFAQISNKQVADIISTTYEYFCTNELLNTGLIDGADDDAFRPSMSQFGGNTAVDTITMIFGLNGLFDMRENTNLHPLAQLSILGKGMVESTIMAFGGAALGTSIGMLPLENILGENAGSIAGSLSGVATSLGMIGLTIGFALYYVLPYLPFIYFMFAAANWFKAIFEAMVGLPLWALAHLRLDGEGIIGEAAADGYWLILEIFLRPFLILVGLLASISIFMAMVKVLNDMFDIVVANVGGFNANDAVTEAFGGTPTMDDPFSLEFYRNPIDQFFYTVIYAVIVYMMALSSFKMIDYIPNAILRWAGLSIKTFGDFQQDHASELMGLVGKGITASAILGGGALGKLDKSGSIGGAAGVAGKGPDET